MYKILLMKFNKVLRGGFIMSWKLEDIPDLAGKTIIVTGANSGLGFELTRELANKGAKVIMACRNLEKASKARQTILNNIGDTDIDILKLDLASLKSIREFAKEYLSKYDKLDVLINNAGIMAIPYTKTEDGYESQLATNYLGHFLLTGLLMPILNNTNQARIINVSSVFHLFCKMDLYNLMCENKVGYHRWNAYSRSKLALLLFTYELQRRLSLAGKSTITLAAHPGIAKTNIMPNNSRLFIGKVITKGISYVLKPAILGAMPILRAASDPNVKGGEYFGPGKDGLPDINTSNKHSHNMEDAKKLWEISEKLCDFHYLD